MALSNLTLVFCNKSPKIGMLHQGIWPIIQSEFWHLQITNTPPYVNVGVRNKTVFLFASTKSEKEILVTSERIWSESECFRRLTAACFCRRGN
jgi:hypothetical protein